MRFRFFFLVLSATFMSCLSAVSQVAEDSVAGMHHARFEAKIAFLINESELDATLENNAAVLDSISRFIDMARVDSDIVIKEMEFSGYASPEGRVEFNTELARKRMDAIEKYVVSKGVKGLAKSYKCDVIGVRMLEDMIERSGIKHRDEALAALRSGPSTLTDAARMWRLRSMQSAEVWEEVAPMLEILRYATVSFSYLKKAPEQHAADGMAVSEAKVEEGSAALDDDTIVAAAPTPAASAEMVVPRQRRPFYMALKTNMLYDAVLIPGGGVEFWLGQRFSIHAYWSYAWWSKNRRHNYWRYYGGEIALRQWFGRLAEKKPLTGHHLGLYAQILTYDFELGGKGYQGNKFNYGGGVEYGFALPIAKRLNIDFTLGVGYLGGKYYEYIPIDGHYVWQATKRRRWLGPTKLEVSLVWLIGHGNTNKPKGGGERQ